MAGARFLVQGLVQGVGYRWFVRRAAERLGLSGVARNLDDGSVEVLVQGDGPAITSLELELRRGPAMARVQRVDKRELPHEVLLPKSFETD
jgi:acylphosphatase